LSGLVFSVKTFGNGRWSKWRWTTFFAILVVNK